MSEAQRRLMVGAIFGTIGMIAGGFLIALIGYTFFPDPSQRTSNLVVIWGSLGTGALTGAAAAWKL